jgi:hypothetical protein
MDRVLLWSERKGMAFAVLLPEESADERSVHPRLAAFWVLKTNVLAMRMLKDPVVTPDQVRLARSLL